MSTLGCFIPRKRSIGCVPIFSFQSEVQIITVVWLEGIEYIISKIPGSDNYENYPNIPNIDGQPSQDSRRVSDDRQTFSEERKSNQGPLSIRPPTIIEEHKRTITFGCFTFETQYHLRFAFLLAGFVQNIYGQTLGVKITLNQFSWLEEFS